MTNPDRAWEEITRKRVRALAVRVGRSMARSANRILVPAGFSIARAPLDLRSVVADPIEAAYRADGRPFVVNVALAHCRSLRASFACTPDGRHPFVATLLAYGRGECRAYVDSPLRSFYDAWQPANAADALGLDPDQAHPVLLDSPAIGAVGPWSAQDPNTAKTRRVRLIESELREQGAAVSHDDGLIGFGFGPVSQARGELEFCRQTRVYESIRRHGYRRSNYPDGDIGGLILSRDGLSRIVISSGHHRVAALAALGHEHAPIRLRPIIVRRDDVGSWPNVCSGLFTREQALAIFDRVFDARQPPGCRWPTVTSDAAMPEHA